MFVFLPLGLQNLKNTFIQWPIRGFYRGGVIYLNRISLLENDTWQCRSLGHPPFHKNLCGQFLLEFSARKIFYRSGLICKLSKKKKKTQKPIKRTLSNTQKNWYYLGNFSILDGNPVEKMRQFLYTWHLLLINPKINDPSSNI